MRLNRLLGLATACLLAPLALPSPAEEVPDEDGKTRVYLEAYGFFPLETHSKTTLDNNTTKETLDLSDVLDMLTGVFSGKVAVEKGRFGLQAGLDHLSFSTSETVSSWDSSNLIQNDRHPRLPQRRVNSKGTIKSVTDSEQTIFDLALRYRAREIQKPRMTPGSMSFIGFAGMRLIDASLDMDVSFKDDVTIEGILPSRQLQRDIADEASETWQNTWVQPLVGMRTPPWLWAKTGRPSSAWMPVALASMANRIFREPSKRVWPTPWAIPLRFPWPIATSVSTTPPTTDATATPPDNMAFRWDFAGCLTKPPTRTT